MIGLTAAEIGLKICLSSLAPDSGWLLEKMQSPSVWRLAKEYLPSLQNRIVADAPDLPKHVLKQIQIGMELRNQVVHRGIDRLGTEQVTDMLRAIKQLLWYLDVCMGQAWATEHVNRSSS